MNGSLGATVQYHRLGHSDALRFRAESCERYRRALAGVERDFEVDSLAVHDDILEDLRLLGFHPAWAGGAPGRVHRPVHHRRLERESRC